MRILGFVVGICLPLLRANAQPTDVMLASIRRVAPSAFRNLPAPVRAALEQRGCRIPQTYSATSLKNVIHGAFTGAKRNEWAVMCSVRDTSQILVLAAATGAVVDSVARLHDVGGVQGIGDGKWGFSRLLSLRPRALIRKWTRDESGPIPQPIDHDAINEAFVGKSAVAYYNTQGKWYRNMTAD